MLSRVLRSGARWKLLAERGRGGSLARSTRPRRPRSGSSPPLLPRLPDDRAARVTWARVCHGGDAGQLSLLGCGEDGEDRGRAGVKAALRWKLSPDNPPPPKNSACRNSDPWSRAAMVRVGVALIVNQRRAAGGCWNTDGEDVAPWCGERKYMELIEGGVNSSLTETRDPARAAPKTRQRPRLRARPSARRERDARAVQPKRGDAPLSRRRCCARRPRGRSGLDAAPRSKPARARAAVLLFNFLDKTYKRRVSPEGCGRRSRPRIWLVRVPAGGAAGRAARAAQRATERSSRVLPDLWGRNRPNSPLLIAPASFMTVFRHARSSVARDVSCTRFNT